MRSDKKIYFDVLRIIALVLVIFNHTAQQGYLVFAHSSSWIIRCVSLVLSSVSKGGVPLFFMISGALLLDKEESLKDVFVKRIAKMLVVLFVFSLIYYIRLYIKNPEYGFSITYFVRYIYEQPMVIPLWYMYSYLAFLLVLPFLRRMVKGMNDSEFRYYILLCILVSYILPSFEELLGWRRYFPFQLVAVNVVYPILGFICAKREESIEKYKKYMLPICALNTIWVLLLNILFYIKYGEFSEIFVENGALIFAMLIFISIKSATKETKINSGKHLLSNDKIRSAVSYIAGCSFCIYLFEEILRADIFVKILSLFSPGLGSLIMCVPYTIAVVLVGIGISSLLKLVPGLKKLGL